MTPEWQAVWQADDFDLRVENAPVGRHSLHRIVAGGGRAGAVVVATCAEKVLLIRHARPIIGLTLWELPRGFGDSTDSDPLETAKRELQEETGVQGGKPQSLGQLWPDSGLLANPVQVVWVPIDEAEASLAANPTDDEAEDRAWYSPEELGNLIRQGELCDAISLGALAIWQTARPR